MSKALAPQQLLSLAIRKFQTGALAEAEELCRAIVGRQRNNVAALQLLGTLLVKRGETDQGIDHLRQGLALSPNTPEAHNNLGNVLRESGRTNEAIDCYRQAIRLRPKFAEAHHNLGLALWTEGRAEEAAASYREAVKFKPNYPEAHNNLGVALQALGEIEDALACHGQAIALKPDYARAHNNLGGALRRIGRLDEAIESYRTAIRLQPDFSEAMHNLGATLQDQGDHDGAIAWYRKALAKNPDNREAQCGLANRLRYVCDWSGLSEEERRVLDIVHQNQLGPSPFHLIPMPAATAADQLQCAKRWAAQYAAAHPYVNRPSPSNGKIRVGYLSSDLHDHATAQLMAEMVELHDRSKFEIFAYSFGGDDASDMRRRLVQAFDRFVDLRLIPHADAAKLIHDDGIHILVDLKGYTRGARPEVMGYRPAPIQVNFLGYPGTMGASFIDYIIGDPIVTPLAQQPFFTETIIQLPDCYQPNDRQRIIAAETPSREDCGLPSAGFVFCSFNNNYKISPEVFDIWMRLLGAVPGSVLWMLEDNASAGENLRREAAARGIAAERLISAPRVQLPAHLARHRLADLFLDTLPCSAHTTASDALWAGLPVLTCTGETFAGRVATSLLNAIGLPELAAKSLKEYEALALALATDAGRLAAVKAKLERNRLTTPLFDSERFTRNLEAAYLGMWERWCADGGADAPPRAPADKPAVRAEAKAAPREESAEQAPFKDRILYEACPLCGGSEKRTVATADCSRHPLYHPKISATMHWYGCSACGHVFTEGYFTDDAARLIFGKTHDHQSVGHNAERQRPISARMVERVAAYIADGHWLDVGFGDGSLLFTAEEWGFTPVGLDLRQSNVAALRRFGIEGHCLPVEEVDQPGRFSVISMADVLEHMPYPRVGLEAAHRLLRPGGVLFASMPNLDSAVWRLLDQERKNPYWGEIEHYHNFGRKRLYALLGENGFEPVHYAVSERYRVCMEVIAIRRDAPPQR